MEDKSDREAEQPIRVVVWAPEVSESQFDQATRLAVALGYVLIDDQVPIDTEGEAVEPGIPDDDGDVANWYRLLEVPHDDDVSDEALSAPPGTSLALTYYPPVTADTMGQLIVTYDAAPE